MTIIFSSVIGSAISCAARTNNTFNVTIDYGIAQNGFRETQFIEFNRTAIDYAQLNKQIGSKQSAVSLIFPALCKTHFAFTIFTLNPAIVVQIIFEFMFFLAARKSTLTFKSVSRINWHKSARICISYHFPSCFNFAFPPRWCAFINVCTVENITSDVAWYS